MSGDANTRRARVLEVIGAESPSVSEAQSTPPTPMPRDSRTVSATPQAMAASFRAIAMILAIRLQLLLVLTGAMVLAVMAMSEPSYLKLSVLATYSVITIIPMVFLDVTARRKP